MNCRVRTTIAALSSWHGCPLALKHVDATFTLTGSGPRPERYATSSHHISWTTSLLCVNHMPTVQQREAASSERGRTSQFTASRESQETALQARARFSSSCCSVGPMPDLKSSIRIRVVASSSSDTNGRICVYKQHADEIHQHQHEGHCGTHGKHVRIQRSVQMRHRQTRQCGLSVERPTGRL